MNLLDKWRRREPGQQMRVTSDNWPPPPTPQPILAGWGGATAPLERSSTVAQSEKYEPAIVIGLGSLGESVLRYLLEDLALDPAGPQQNLRLVLITERPVPDLPLGSIEARQFDLEAGALRTQSAASRRQSNVRQSLLERFLHPDVLDPVSSYLRISLSALRTMKGSALEPKMIVVGSFAEAEIALLGHLMHLLSLHSRNSGAGAAKRVALLGIGSGNPQLSQEERFAALRELGRLTFPVKHILPSPVSQEQLVSEGALIDFLFLMEANTRNTGHESPTDLELSQILNETLYQLLHPSGIQLWAHLQNYLNNSAAVRSVTHMPVAYGAGIASLYVPVTEIQTYVAARLASAVIFGEKQYEPEGLIGNRLHPVDYHDTAVEIARNLLLRGRGSHPMLEQLLEIAGPNPFFSKALPHEYYLYLPLLPSKVAYGLEDLLNDGHPDPLERAIAGIDWLENWLANLTAWCNQTSPPGRYSAHQDWRHVLSAWKDQVNEIRGQLVTWQRALVGKSVATTLSDNPSPADVHVNPTTGNSSLDPNWRAVLQKSHAKPDNHILSSDNASARATSDQKSLYQILLDERESAEQRLEMIVAGSIRRPLTALLSDSLDEAKNYYEDTVRPELSQPGLASSRNYSSLRSRLRWWVRISSSGPPRLVLVCVPADDKIDEGARVPPRAAEFSPDEVARLAETLMDLAAVQTQQTAANLTGPWLQERISSRPSADFLKRANQTYLNFDPQEARRLYDRALSPKYYLVGRVPDEYSRQVFPDAATERVNNLPDGEPTKVSAFKLTTDIPVPAIALFANDDRRRRFDAGFYLYEPERLAAQYESNLNLIRRDPYQMPPDFVCALTDSELVGVFFQSLFSGLLAARQSRGLDGQRHWSIELDFAQLENSLEADKQEDDHDQQGQRWQPLILSEFDHSQGWRSLWIAMRAFTLDKRYHPGLYSKPTSHFHPENFPYFLADLKEKIRQVRRIDNGVLVDQNRQRIEETYLRPWRSANGKDLLGLAFLDVMELELRRPTWR